MHVLKNPVVEMEGNVEIYVLNDSVLRCMFQNVIAYLHSTIYSRITISFFPLKFFFLYSSSADT